jgi:hypothetical protein
MRWRILLSTLVLTTFLLAATESPPLSILSRFTAPGVPTLGPDEHPGDAPGAQFLEQSGIPEKPGALQR